MLLSKLYSFFIKMENVIFKIEFMPILMLKYEYNV